LCRMIYNIHPLKYRWMGNTSCELWYNCNTALSSYRKAERTPSCARTVAVPPVAQPRMTANSEQFSELHRRISMRLPGLFSLFAFILQHPRINTHHTIHLPCVRDSLARAHHVFVVHAHLKTTPLLLQLHAVPRHTLHTSTPRLLKATVADAPSGTTASPPCPRRYCAPSRVGQLVWAQPSPTRVGHRPLAPLGTCTGLGVVYC
jgi:hypothetical protein